MQLTQDKVLLLIALLVISGLCVYIFFTCRCNVEKFENGDEEEEEFADSADADLNAKERQLFNDLKSGKLSDEEIQEFISNGELTEKMVEKFLQQIDTQGDDDDEDKPAAAKPAANAAAEEVEGFEGGAAGCPY